MWFYLFLSNRGHVGFNTFLLFALRSSRGAILYWCGVATKCFSTLSCLSSDDSLPLNTTRLFFECLAGNEGEDEKGLTLLLLLPPFSLITYSSASIIN